MNEEAAARFVTPHALSVLRIALPTTAVNVKPSLKEHTPVKGR